MKSRYQNPQSGKSIEWLVQPKRRCQTWLYLLSYLRHKWCNNEETGFISDKTSNPWAIHVENSIDEFGRGLTPLAPDRLRRGRAAVNPLQSSEKAEVSSAKHGGR